MKGFCLRLLAALSFFTRLPFWRLGHIREEHYRRVVPLWPVAGWLTGALSALVLWAAGWVLPIEVAVPLALLARVLLTGALHEDGLADFCDGFGGGGTRERTLAIMKDSRIGTYGVLGLILYFLLIYNVELSIGGRNYLDLCLAVFSADAFAKWAASLIINILPYARTAEQAKNKFVYQRMSMGEAVVGMAFGWAPTLLLFSMSVLWAALASLLVALGMMCLMARRLHGYTGDCCGATMLVSELAYLLVFTVVAYCL